MPDIPAWRDGCGPLIEQSGSLSVFGPYVLVEPGRVMPFICDVRKYDEGLMVEVRLRQEVTGPTIVAGGSKDGLMLLEWESYELNAARLRRGEEPNGYYRLLPWPEA